MYMWNHVEYTMECEGKAGLSQTFLAKFPPGSIRNSEKAMPSDNSSLENLATSAQHRCKGAYQLSIFFNLDRYHSMS